KEETSMARQSQKTDAWPTILLDRLEGRRDGVPRAVVPRSSRTHLRALPGKCPRPGAQRGSVQHVRPCATTPNCPASRPMRLDNGLGECTRGGSLTGVSGQVAIPLDQALEGLAQAQVLVRRERGQAPPRGPLDEALPQQVGLVDVL